MFDIVDWEDKLFLEWKDLEIDRLREEIKSLNKQLYWENCDDGEELERREGWDDYWDNPGYYELYEQISAPAINLWKNSNKVADTWFVQDAIARHFADSQKILDAGLGLRIRLPNDWTTSQENKDE